MAAILGIQVVLLFSTGIYTAEIQILEVWWLPSAHHKHSAAFQSSRRISGFPLKITSCCSGLVVCGFF